MEKHFTISSTSSFNRDDSLDVKEILDHTVGQEITKLTSDLLRSKISSFSFIQGFVSKL